MKNVSNLLYFSILLYFSKLLYFSYLLDFSRFVFIWQICQIVPKIPYCEKLKYLSGMTISSYLCKYSALNNQLNYMLFYGVYE